MHIKNKLTFSEWTLMCIWCQKTVAFTYKIYHWKRLNVIQKKQKTNNTKYGREHCFFFACTYLSLQSTVDVLATFSFKDRNHSVLFYSFKIASVQLSKVSHSFEEIALISNLASNAKGLREDNQNCIRNFQR